MATGELFSDVMFAANAVGGGLLVALVLGIAFVVVGRALLMVRHIRALHANRANGNAHARRSTTPGAAVLSD
jgi:hypothetical protein